ncbi:MAG: HD domain-containing protein [bacterium]|nr:HD domain-containing protein [bacterium]
MNFEQCKKAFDQYTSNYDLNQEMVQLKYQHSYVVADLMAELAFRLELPKEDILLAKTIGLLHDIGRFEQLKQYHSFDDKNVDHAEASCTYLFEEGHIRDFVSETKYDAIIEKAIRYHNKIEIPEMEERESLFSKMIRDMDKVDIYKQIAVHFDSVFKAEEVTPEVLELFKKEESIPKSITKSKSDKVLIFLSFLFNIYFNPSFDILVETDNFDLFLSTVNVDNHSERLWKKIREICFDKINKGIGD